MKDIFKKYTNKYDQKDDLIKMKVSHSKRVMTICEIIAKSENMDERQIHLAKIIGLFHDIGRFNQAKVYKTFDDSKSIDHGDAGYDIFLKEIVPSLDLSLKETKIIGKAIKYHNKLKIGRCTSEELQFIKLIRDADKIDIFYQLANNKKLLEEPIGEISEECHNSFMNHTIIDYNNRVTNNDINISKLALIWELNYDYSFKLLKDYNYIEKIHKILKNDIYKPYFEEIKKFLEEK